MLGSSAKMGCIYLLGQGYESTFEVEGAPSNYYCTREYYILSGNGIRPFNLLRVQQAGQLWRDYHFRDYRVPLSQHARTDVGTPNQSKCAERWDPA